MPTNATALAIRALIAQGLPIATVAKALGVSAYRVRQSMRSATPPIQSLPPGRPRIYTPERLRSALGPTFGRTQFREATGLSATSASAMLVRLRKRGVIIKLRRAVYAIAESSEPPRA